MAAAGSSVPTTASWVTGEKWAAVATPGGSCRRAVPCLSIGPVRLPAEVACNAGPIRCQQPILAHVLVRLGSLAAGLYFYSASCNRCLCPCHVGSMRPQAARLGEAGEADASPC